jgi:hypothetical protein
MSMEIESIRPILSGTLGGLLAIYFCNALSRWVPKVCNGKSADTLTGENRVAIWIANSFFFLGILGGIAIYSLGYLPNDDWRGLAVGTGGGSIAALAVFPAFAIGQRRSVKEAYVAYAISQQTPLMLVFGILMTCIALFAAAVGSLAVEFL